jgi:predicted ATP-grasp superfamily ATP-dependent carboligase
MKKTGNVFVADAQMRNSLAIIRSLGAKGLKVTAGEETNYATGLFSKYCHNKKIYPSPYREPNSFIQYMLDEVRVNQYDVIFPVTPATVLPIVKRMDEFSDHTVVPYPKYEILSRAMDRIETVKSARDNGIPCPRTYYMGRFGDRGFEDVAGKIEYPVAIKPAMGALNGEIICDSLQEFTLKCMQANSEYGPFLVQEILPSGGEIGVYTLFDAKSKPVALSVQKRIRSYPSEGGSSTLRETVKDETAVDHAIKLLSSMKWTGLAMVEYATDPRDGELKLLSVNPLIWGSLQLSMLAGANFPYLLYRMAMGEEIEPDLSYETGIKCRWLLPGDLLWYLSTPGKIKNLPSLMTSNTADDIISLKDPRPTLGFIMALAKYFSDKETVDQMMSRL